MLQSLLLTLLLGPLLLASSNAYSSSEKDPNSYPWGDNPNNGYKMYWKDSPNILNSLTEFDSLYVKVHGCVWSEYGLGVAYDDDGENHDGDEQWYLTRIQPFRANAAFSLYGILRGESNMGRKCRKGTYINTFFTYEGADTVLQAFQSSVQTAFPDGGYGSAYCYEYETDDDDDGSDSSDSGDRRVLRELGSDSGDGDGGESMTMGCSAESKFVAATFEGSACDGAYFMNTTDELKDYNSAMGHLSCSQVWNYRKAMRNGGRKLEEDAADDYYGENDDGAGDDEAAAGDDNNANDDGSSSSSTTYGSIAETLLASSFACDIQLFPNGLCPDPYGKKAKYAANINASAKKGKSVRLTNWQSPMLVFSWLFFLAGIGMAAVAYFILRRENAKAKGRGVAGWARQIWTDLYKLLCRRKKEKKSPGSPVKKERKRSSKTKSKSKIKDVTAIPESVEDTRRDTTVSPSTSNSSRRKKSKSSRKKRDKYDDDFGGTPNEIV
eukprot:CAMPEP_0119011328 /NCGR_PEP_ID=MMETSP1176-20130426/5603_1 /TAXON_ID=265551 /ORGANISM="Synedropsis recta cf, Strain CCMP1620" /LENGTH=494 /DNA_ID=CAMNT_0006964131 /DNA_START=30 /DNA_END=1514 /DNA_ORIENTATION=+